MSLLSLVQNVCAYVKVVRPMSVVNSTDPNVVQLFALANEEGNDLASSFDWQVLTEEGLFTTANAAAQPGGVPADMDHFIPGTFWNRTTRRPMKLVSPQEWQTLQAFPNLNPGGIICYRERQGQLLAFPSPPAGQLIAFEYVSLNWCQNAAKTAMPAYQNDTDVSFLDETLMALGLRWRFLKANGLDYSEDFRTYESNKAQAQARDGPSSALMMQGECERMPWDGGGFVTGQIGYVTSGPATVVLPAPVAILPPTITGTAQVGQTLTCSTGSWLNSPTSYAFQWFRSGALVSGATGASYALTSADLGSSLTCAVTGTNTGGSATATAGPTATVIAAPAPGPNLTGYSLVLLQSGVVRSAPMSNAKAQ